LKGNEPWNKGKTDVYSDESIRKMSESAKSRKIDDDVENIRRSKISKYFSENHPNRISLIDTRTDVQYKSVKQFCDDTDTSFYIFKKLRNDGIIIEQTERKR
jgi:hypothetical protein